MRVGFVTCVRLGLSCMETLYEAGGRVAHAVSLHDHVAPAKSGRVYLDSFCAEHEIPLQKVRNINDPDAIAALHAAQLDWLFIVGWSQIAAASVLGAPRGGVLGMHPTLLPVGRGRAPIPWAILLSLPATGVTLFKMDAGMDSGPIVAQLRIPIEARETATTLYDKVERAHSELLRAHWPALSADRLTFTPQDEHCASVWPGRKPEDGRIAPDGTVLDADRLIRATTRPYPGAFMDEPRGRVRIWSSGSPGEDRGGSAAHSGVRRFRFRDGWLDATDYAIEP